MIVRSGKSKICWAGSRLETQGRVDVAVVQGQSAGRIPSLEGGDLSLFSCKIFSWLGEAHPHNAVSSALLKIYWSESSSH